MALGAGLHAVAGFVEIVKETWGIRPHTEDGQGTESATTSDQVGAASWILFGAVTLGIGAVLHAVAVLRQIIKEILHPTS
jgi:hypothetical protein